ncbi:hypothetical protein THIOM_002252 [Candidatus Thiomargarita nelsonii]|uniref:Uncharacterized protein n=1 Tax=Candidatus Thiomargarita nelsonii TaxID=1003181 RepID=A0A176S1S4_9GAMM|nr:hypothetical protein THIOM_002252 [Candidatus Thiomargarita nelsonii]
MSILDEILPPHRFYFHNRSLGYWFQCKFFFSCFDNFVFLLLILHSAQAIHGVRVKLTITLSSTFF